MRLASKLVKILCCILTVFSIILFSTIAFIDSKITDNYKVSSDIGLNIDTYLPVKATYNGQEFQNVSKLMNVGSRFDVKLKIFGIIPVTTANVEVIDESYVVPLGIPFGMKIYTKGVLVVDLTDVDAPDGYYNPAQKAGLKIGDTIISINGKNVYSNTDVSSMIEKCEGKSLTLIVERDSKQIKINVKPVKSKSTGVYKAGIWVRDSSAGIGTLTFYSPVHNTVCGLGHGVCDNDTGSLLKVNSGEIVGAEIISFDKAKKGAPGELKGRITNEKFADIRKNSLSGVYGSSLKNFDTSKLMPIAVKQEIENGTAYIITTISGTQPTMYACKVKKIKNSNQNQNLLVEITDKELLSKTGGILQGMSGSPIIQNGKLIGAVTHVLIDDSAKGYGIYAENMLETARSVELLNEAS